MKILSLVAALIFISLNLISCSENISSVGGGLVNQSKFTVADTSLIATGDSTFHSNIANGSGYYNLVGAANSVEAKTLLNFIGLSVGDGDTLSSVQLATCEMQLHVGYLWNMSSTAQQFEIHEILTPWTATIPIDSSDNISFSPTVCGTINQIIADTSTIIVNLDTSEVRKWITALTDSTAPPFYGFAIMPQPGATNTGIWGFVTFNALTSSSPLLRIRYTKNGVEDSVSFSYGNDTFLAKNSSALLPSLIDVQAGVGRRSKITFDLSSLVKQSFINNASLELTLNPQSAHGTSTPDSVAVLLIINSQYPDTINGSYYYYGKRKDTTQTANPVYSIPLSTFAQLWVNNTYANDGILLEASGENSSVDRYVFYSSHDPDPAKRPVLHLTYTKK